MSDARAFAPGDRVLWRGSWGTGFQAVVTIIGVGDRDGEEVFDLDNGHWAYGTQLRFPIAAMAEWLGETA